MDTDNKIRVGFLIVVAALAMVGMVFVPPIPQDPNYHLFADDRTILGIPNFWNVISNLPLLIIGLVGVRAVGRGVPQGGVPALRAGYFLFFAGAALSGLGSAWYHLNPTNQTLVWDRLPMTISFMSFFAVVAGEYISVDTGRRLLWPLVGIGMLTIAYWAWTEAQDSGDLRPYALVQFLPGILIILILCMFRPQMASSTRITANGYIWGLVVAYALAKLTEFLDAPIFDALRITGGHAIKHLFVAGGVLMVYLAITQRKTITQRDWISDGN